MFGRLYYWLILILCFFDLVHSTDPSVIIIGAGPAGIAAATKLLENSITNITILEAENRTGGRIHSVKFGKGFIELGAEYCFGEKGNIVYELAKGYNVFESANLTLGGNVYYSDGSTISSSLSTDLDKIIFENLNPHNYSSEKSLGEVLTHSFNSTLLKTKKEEELKILKTGLRFVEGYILLMKGAKSWFDCSAKSDHVNCEGRPDLSWKGVGYKTMLDILSKSYPNPNLKLAIDDKIQFNKQVQKINWKESETVRVTTSDGNSYTADYVIFTPSLGVLKEKKDSLFNPALPSEKKQAIENIGFGEVAKLVVQFSTKWWHDNDNVFSFYWSEEDLKSTNYTDGLVKDGASWITQIRDITKTFDNPNIWTAWISGNLVSEIENLPVESLKHGLNHVLNKFLGKIYNVTEIDNIFKFTWTSNENFLGTSTFTKTGLYNNNVSYFKCLGEPLNGVDGKPTLLFAGEATHPTYFSTVHGAIETGHREAERIINLHNIAN